MPFKNEFDQLLPEEKSDEVKAIKIQWLNYIHDHSFSLTGLERKAKWVW